MKKILVLVLVLSAFLRIIGLPWGLINKDGFEPDETQHFAIACELIHVFNQSACNQELVKLKQFNGRALGTQIALLGYPPISLLNADIKLLYGFGRIISLVYSLLLVLVVFFLAKAIFSSNKIALLSALLLGIFDLNVTYSHYGVPDIPHVFWIYLFLFLLISIFQRMKDKIEFDNEPYLIPVAMSAAMAISFRFDIVPTAILFCLIFFSFIKKKISFAKTSRLMLFSGLAIIAFFYISVGFNYDLEDAKYSLKILHERNQNTLISDSHLLHNPILYTVAVIGGISIPVFALFIAGLVLIIRRFRTFEQRNKLCLKLLFLFVSLEFFILWIGDATFVRRANIFLPAIAIVAAHGFYTLSDVLKLKIKIVNASMAFVLIYTLCLTLTSQYNFIKDPRYRAREYINTVANESGVCYSLYAYVNGMPDVKHKKLVDCKESKYLVVHETYYARYWKYFSTPFKVPKCCDEVYHCDPSWCSFVQDIFNNKTSYALEAEFRAINLFPERKLFYKFFGNYETFMGDVLIYKKKDI